MKPTNKTYILTQHDLIQIIELEGIDNLMDKLFSFLEKAIHKYSFAETKIPVRSGFNYSHPESGLVEWMPSYEKGKNVVIKLVGYHPNNPEKFDRPTIASTISAYSTETGQLIGLMDGVLPTALRTGVASAIASKYLAKKDSSIVGLIGCGAQSITQLHALSRIFPIKEVLIFDPDQSAQSSFQDRIEALDLNVSIIESSIKEIVSKSDIISTQSSINIGEGPLFDNIDTQPHLHINAVGSDFPGKIELPLSLLNNAFVTPDFLDQALHEGECQQLMKGHVGPELEQIVKFPSVYESKKKEITVFDSTGWALEDKVVFDLFMNLAREYNIGQLLDIEYMPKDAKNPYEFLKVPINNY